MTRVLWDTNVITHWLLDEPSFRPGIQKVVASFGVSRSFYVSTVTTQELMIWARPRGRAEATYAFMAEHFTPLDFSETCALEAARLVSVVSEGEVATPADTTHEMRQLQRDAAIIATASCHELDVLFTTRDKEFARFVSHVPCKILAPVSIV
jgi:predicted nucleic acid-binding protein